MNKSWVCFDSVLWPGNVMTSCTSLSSFTSVSIFLFVTGGKQREIPTYRWHVCNIKPVKYGANSITLFFYLTMVGLYFYFTDYCPLTRKNGPLPILFTSPWNWIMGLSFSLLSICYCVRIMCRCYCLFSFFNVLFPGLEIRTLACLFFLFFKFCKVTVFL